MTFSSFSQPLASHEATFAVQASPSSLATVMPSTLCTQLANATIDQGESQPCKTQITLHLASDISIGLTPANAHILDQSLQSAIGQLEVFTSAYNEFLEFRFNRLSSTGEEYPTRLLLHGMVF
ncbi:hypothetical protein Krac_6785 [Ktedonobacter racemifer DSM 44963]|uniref:Uncharacterized protein n=1 Tax=Ktedonobacter racemifer DSM 44963 TaxID=485913 RepID=D6TPE7_KTERA|nr:hypothetical protein Krac_6785 [Ktedonobacter racemifer DSM 44963]